MQARHKYDFMGMPYVEYTEDKMPTKIDLDGGFYQYEYSADELKGDDWMETRQLEHGGFEHTNEWRVPGIDEWFQDSGGEFIFPRPAQGGFDRSLHGGKRWILRKTVGQIKKEWWGNPKREEAIQHLIELISSIGQANRDHEKRTDQLMEYVWKAVEKLKEAK